MTFSFLLFISLLLSFEQLGAFHSVVKKLVVSYMEMISKVLYSDNFIGQNWRSFVNCFPPWVFHFIFYLDK